MLSGSGCRSGVASLLGKKVVRNEIARIVLCISFCCYVKYISISEELLVLSDERLQFASYLHMKAMLKCYIARAVIFVIGTSYQIYDLSQLCN